VLERRPDVASAERALTAAKAALAKDTDSTRSIR